MEESFLLQFCAQVKFSRPLSATPGAADHWRSVRGNRAALKMQRMTPDEDI